MTGGLLLDTHIVLWLDSGDSRLRPSTRTVIENHWQDGGTIYVSAVTAWEIALLADMGHIGLDCSADAWTRRFLDRPGIGAAPLSTSAAARSYDLHGLATRDPADRLLTATAIELACPLVTYDKRIASFAKRHGRKYGFGVEA